MPVKFVIKTKKQKQNVCLFFKCFFNDYRNADILGVVYLRLIERGLKLFRQFAVRFECPMGLE